MPLAYEIVEAHRLVVIRAWGEIDDAGILAHAERFCTDPRILRSYDQYGDYTGVTGFAGLTMHGMREGARMLDAYERETHGIRLALVMGSLAAYGMGRMYQLLRRSPLEIEVFRDEASALGWLQRPAEAVAWLHTPLP